MNVVRPGRRHASSLATDPKQQRVTPGMPRGAGLSRRSAPVAGWEAARVRLIRCPSSLACSAMPRRSAGSGGPRPPGWARPQPDALARPSARLAADAAVRSAIRRAGVPAYRLRYRFRGWNADGATPDPVSDARWALDEIRRRHGDDVPIVLVGHSMGGRTALWVAGDAQVAGVVALAPWCEAGDPVDQLAGRDVLIAHGTRDRITSPSGSLGYARRARRGRCAGTPSRGRGGDPRHAPPRRRSGTAW